jgi:hypothetical protein
LVKKENPFFPKILYFGALHLNLFVPNIQFYKYSAALPLNKWFLLSPGDPSLVVSD